MTTKDEQLFHQKSKNFRIKKPAWSNL